MIVAPEDLSRIVDILANAQSALFITGAGISADSGLPTYRGIGGLYNDSGTEDGLPIEVALAGQMLMSRPDIAWKHIARIEQSCRGAKANRGHEIIAALQERIPRVCVLTQNVDGFHGAAGSRNLIEIHGNVHRLVCTGCARRRTVEDYAALDIPPYCEHCEQLIRPDVVLFGEMLPSAAIDALQRELTQGFDVVFTIGTTSAFPYIAAPVLQARRKKVPTIEINPGDSEVSEVVDIRIRAGAKDALEAIFTLWCDNHPA